MKFRIIVSVLIIVSIITGCTNGEKKEIKLTVDNVTAAIRAEGSELFYIGQFDDEFAVLNNVKPNVFCIGNPLEDVAKLEKLYVYIFDSEQDRIDGLKTFNQHLEFAKLVTYPTAYEQKNALVIYFSFSKKNMKFDEKIQIAMQKL